jgi:uncharacterized integral membrane protein
VITAAAIILLLKIIFLIVQRNDETDQQRKLFDEQADLFGRYVIVRKSTVSGLIITSFVLIFRILLLNKL